jgi:hypothetical protein
MSEADVIKVLDQKRAELAAQIETKAEELATLKMKLASLDLTMKLLAEPSTNSGVVFQKPREASLEMYKTWILDIDGEFSVSDVVKIASAFGFKGNHSSVTRAIADLQKDDHIAAVRPASGRRPALYCKNPFRNLIKDMKLPDSSAE